MYSKSLTEKIQNEDAIGIAKHLFVVCDGASSLTKKTLKDPVSDAAWFSHGLCSLLLQEENSKESLEDLLARCIVHLCGQFPACSPLDSPSAAIAIVRTDPKRNCLDLLVLGDCEILLLTKEGVRSFFDPAIASFDQKAIDKMEQEANKTGRPFLECRPAANEILMENRLQKNKPSGYWIADLSLDWKGRSITGSLPLDQVMEAAVFSDGFAQLAQFEKLSPDTFFRTIRKDPQKALERLYLAQEDDWQAQKVRRLKKRDDTSLIYIDEKTLHQA